MGVRRFLLQSGVSQYRHMPGWESCCEALSLLPFYTVWIMNVLFPKPSIRILLYNLF